MGDEKLRLMVADDERHLRRTFAMAARLVGFETVAEANNGQEAVDLYKVHKPDLLLLDINMPIKTGLEALGEIIAHDPDANVIILTSLADQHSVDTAVELGATNYILKSTPIDQIRAILTEFRNDFLADPEV